MNPARTRPPALPRRLPAVLAATLVAVALLAACSSSSTTATSATTAGTVPTRSAQPYVLRVGFINPKGNTWYAPQGYSMAHGDFNQIMAASGVTSTKTISFPAGTSINEAFQGGQIDVAIETDTPAIIGKAGGIDTRLLDTATLGQDAWISVKPGGPTSVAGLAGTTVGVQTGTYADRYLRGVLQGAGLTSKVTVTNIAPADAFAALASGSIAAYASPAPFGQIYASKGFKPIDQAVRDHPALTGASYTIALSSFLTAHPEFIAAWEKARLSALKEITVDFSGFQQYQADALGLTPALEAAAGNPLSAYPIQRFPARAEAQLTATQAFLFSQHIIEHPFSIRDWYEPGPS
jgi:sulfonate transport system substrate-binding protein